jgi:lipopolysaccharide/colanic/teichoic acid biosynthesis glycosyltransferase
MNSQEPDLFVTDVSIDISIEASISDVRALQGKLFAFGIKRCVDLLVSCIFLILLLPIFAVIAIAIKLDSPGSVFHKQYRIGLKGKEFQMWKFRTMVEAASELQHTLESKNQTKGGVLFKIKADPRCTIVGRFLRRYSLDELPQIINVIKGEMSLVGPRPLILRDANKLPVGMQFRHNVLPGITGLWQIKGRSSLDVEQLYYWDRMYIQTWSLLLDTSILWQTITVVIQGNGSY